MTERTSYLTAAELRAAQVLHQRAPYALTNVSCSFFNVARHYGALTFQGCSYTYMPEHDECVRDDVLRLATRMRRLKAKAAVQQQAEKQMALPMEDKT